MTVLACAATASAEGLPFNTPQPTEAPMLVEVYANWPAWPTNEQISPVDSSPPALADSAEMLRSAAGVDAGRMGGHGLEPVIRGQQQTQLQITNNGAYIFGGCPNRMDPPSSMLEASAYDRIEVSRGYQTVTRGPGGSGGSIVFERDAAKFSSVPAASGRIGGALNSNGAQRHTYLDANLTSSTATLRGFGSLKAAGNYHDGSNNLVRSSFKQESMFMAGGTRLGGNATTTLSLDYDQVRDALFPGSGMDSPETEALTANTNTDIKVDSGILKLLAFQAYSSLVDHSMDNFSLRPPPPNGPLAETLSDSDTFGGRILAQLNGLGGKGALGIDSQSVMRNAQRGVRPSGAPGGFRTQSLLWPDTELSQVGLFAEYESLPIGALEFGLGARLDTVFADSDAANRPPEVAGMSGARTPNALYRAYYGTDASSRIESNPAGLARLRYHLTEGASLVAGFSRSMRTADTTERYIASDMGPNSWIGNPGLKPETHWQTEAGIEVRSQRWYASAVGYYDKVDDYIFRDLARSQPGILLSDGASVYRNIDAQLSGIEFASRVQVTSSLSASLRGAFTYGENNDSHQPLPQIPPLSMRFNLEYAMEQLAFGGEMAVASRQNRVDDNPLTGSGRDVRKTPGYGTTGIYLTYSPRYELKFRAGISNLFDKLYANHLNRSNAFDPEEIQVNEPGRSFYLSAHWDFS